MEVIYYVVGLLSIVGPTLFSSLKLTSCSRFQIDRGIIVIPKTISKNRISENFNVWDFSLTKDDIEIINSLDCNGRLIPQAE